MLLQTLQTSFSCDDDEKLKTSGETLGEERVKLKSIEMDESRHQHVGDECHRLFEI
jgi:hypothetical protein